MTAEPLDPMHAEDPMRLSGARWCDEHERWECSKQRSKQRGPCHGSAVRGLSQCRLHVGKELDLAKTQGEANLAIWSAAAGGGLEPVDQAEAVMSQLRVMVLRADCVGELVRLQVADEDVEGLVGKTYAAGRDGVRVETGESLRGLAKYEMDLRDRVVKYAEAAHRMGIATRQVELAQAQAEAVVLAFRAALDAGGAELLPAVRAVMVSTFLNQLGRGELEGSSAVSSVVPHVGADR